MECYPWVKFVLKLRIGFQNIENNGLIADWHSNLTRRKLPRENTKWAEGPWMRDNPKSMKLQPRAKDCLGTEGARHVYRSTNSQVEKLQFI